LPSEEDEQIAKNTVRLLNAPLQHPSMRLVST
jgi:hypothetical protein